MSTVDFYQTNTADTKSIIKAFPTAAMLVSLMLVNTSKLQLLYTQSYRPVEVHLVPNYNFAGDPSGTPSSISVVPRPNLGTTVICSHFHN